MAPTIQEVREQIALPIHPWKLKKNENEQVCFNSPFVIIYGGFEFHLAVEDRRHMRFHEKCNCSVGGSCTAASHGNMVSVPYVSGLC